MKLEVVIDFDQRKVYVEGMKSVFDDAFRQVMNALEHGDSVDLYAVKSNRIHRFSITTRSQLRQFVLFLASEIGQDAAERAAELMLRAGFDWQWALSYLTGLKYRDGQFIARSGLVIPEHFAANLVERCEKKASCVREYVERVENGIGVFKI
ncbi:MAG: hypothetical protein ACP5I3_11695 [Thermoproteus sp.]